MTATLVFHPDGTAQGLYTEAIDLTLLGHLTVKRASRVEFNDARQCWQVRTMGGRTLFSAPTRQRCLEWEQQHFTVGNGRPTTKGARDEVQP